MRRILAFLAPLIFLAACVSTSNDTPEAETPRELIDRGDGHFDRRAYENAGRLYELAALSASGPEYVEAASQVAHTLVLREQVPAAREWIDVAGKRANREEAASYVRFLIARGAVEQGEGRQDRALVTFEEAHDLALARGQSVRAVQAAHWASVTCGDERSIGWCRKAIDAAKGNATLEAALWTQLAWLLEERGLHDDALTAFQQARSKTNPEDERARLIADWSAGHGLRVVGRLEEARALMDSVLTRAAILYQRERQPNTAEWLGHAHFELGELEWAAGDPDLARRHWTLARERLREAGARRLAPEKLAAVESRLADVEE